MLPGDGVDGIHLAGYPRVVYRHYRLRLFGDGPLDQLLVEVHRVGADVDEHALGPAHGERVGRGDERERGHYHLVAGFDSAEQRRHLERVRAAGGEQRPGAARLGLQPGVALLVELPVAANAPALDGGPHVIDFRPHEGRLVEWDSHNDLKVNHFFARITQIRRFLLKKAFFGKESRNKNATPD